jgi:hypothetical protein
MLRFFKNYRILKKLLTPLIDYMAVLMLLWSPTELSMPCINIVMIFEFHGISGVGFGRSGLKAESSAARARAGVSGCRPFTTEGAGGSAPRVLG